MKKDWMIIESELDDDQIKVLNAVNDKSCIVSGCAGSGKSVLALIKAQRIQREKGNDYQIIVYTKALCNYMNAGRKELKLNNDFSYHQEWKYNRIPKTYSNGATYLVYERDEFGKFVPKDPLPSSDYIIVDEIQDFSKEEILEFVNSTHKHFFFFGDTAQSIYKGIKDTLPVEKIPNILPLDRTYKTFELYRNYRLPKSVAKVVSSIINIDGFDLDTYKSKEISIPRFVQFDNFLNQIDAIVHMLNTYDLSDVGILVPDNDDVKTVHDVLKQKGINHELKYEDKQDRKCSINNLDFSTSNPKVMTYHSAKGLQFETVFLPGIVEKRDDSQINALYVAMTRTYRNLYVLYSGNMPFPLSEVPADLYKTTLKDEVEDI